MKIDELKTIMKFIKFYDKTIDEQFNNFTANDDLNIYFLYDCGLLNIQTNKLVKDAIKTDYFDRFQKEELFYYDYEYKINIPISKVYKYLLYNVKTNKLDTKKGIELKNYFTIAKNLEQLFQLLTDQDNKNLIISSDTLLRIIKETFVFNTEFDTLLFEDFYNINNYDAFDQIINEKEIYLPLLVYYDMPGDKFNYKLILELEYNFIINNTSSDALINEVTKNIDKIKNSVFEYLYSHKLSNLTKYFTIMNTGPEYASVKSMKVVIGLKLLFNFEYIKELLYIHFIDKILTKV